MISIEWFDHERFVDGQLQQVEQDPSIPPAGTSCTIVILYYAIHEVNKERFYLRDAGGIPRALVFTRLCSLLSLRVQVRLLDKQIHHLLIEKQFKHINGEIKF